jgi:hypothetical protein
MTEPPHDSHGEPTPDQAAADVFTRLAPYEKSIAGTTPAGGSANSILVTAVAVYDPTEHPDEEAMWAADFGERQLVRVDTNYKATRPGEHPADLSRPDAARLAATVLEAIEDTFHYSRVGGLRTEEAARLLSVLDEVDYALASLRAHALDDLCARLGVDPDGPGTALVEPVDGGRPDARPFHERRRPT